MKLNEACQKTHVLAIDVFLIMLLSLNIALVFTQTTYEIIPEQYATQTANITFTTFQPTTEYQLITQTQYDAIIQPRKELHNKITLFGIIIFLLYVITQIPRYKKQIIAHYP